MPGADVIIADDGNIWPVIVGLGGKYNILCCSNDAVGRGVNISENYIERGY